MPLAVVGAGPEEWVWAAIAAGDVPAVRAAPATFDIDGIHPKYGSVLTAFLQALLNLEGRFLVGSRAKLAKELVDELGRRGARPDLLIPAANLEVKGLYQDWRLTGDVTAMQAVIQMRNDLMSFKFDCKADDDEKDGCNDDAQLLSDLIDKYAELTARRASSSTPRLSIPEAIVGVWERCLSASSGGDVAFIATDGTVRAHSLLVTQASPVLAAMLTSGMRESLRSSGELSGELSEVPVQASVSVVRLLLTLLYTGCLPPQLSSEETPDLHAGVHVTVTGAFMSNSAKSVLLPAGLAGEVQSTDAAGDVLIKFDGMTLRQWVTRKNFGHLRAGVPEGLVRLHEDLAGALALSHCWQVPGLAEVLAERLERGVTPETLGTTLEVAELHGFQRLRAACLALAQNSSKVRATYNAGNYSLAVMSALHSVFDGGSKKRPRDPL